MTALLDSVEHMGDRLFIGGEWTTSRDGDVVDVVDPASGTRIDRVGLGGPQDVGAAVSAAAEAAESWTRTPPGQRAAVLRKMADLIRDHAAEIATLVTRQNGMPITLSTGANGYFPAILLRYYADLVDQSVLADERSGMRGSRTLVERRPVGVVGAITPWNYPQTLAAMKYAPALAAGCTVVLKPPPETALDAHLLAAIAREAGVPAGVFNVVPGDRDAGAALVSHPRVDKIAFTGSTAAGRAIGEVCGRLLKPVTLELGGKSAAILLEDLDLETYLDAIPRVSLPNSGQTCHSSTRILAPRARYAEIADGITDAVRALRVGDPLDPATQVGALVSTAQQQRVLDYIRLGIAEGAKVTTGGGVPVGLEAGAFVEPTVLVGVDNSARVAQDEIFGPVLTVIPYDDLDHAVRLANDSEYGLAGTVWTADEDRGIEVARRIQTGSIGVNRYGLDPAAPFGGWKASGLGVELGPEGLETYRRPQSIYVKGRI